MKRVALDVTFLQDNAAQKSLKVTSRVLLNLLSHHNVRGGAYPGRATIASELGITERSVRRALRELEADDMIRRYGDYKGHARYRLPVGKKNELLGGPDRWKIIEDFHSTLARIRPHSGADSSATWREPVRKGGANLSSPPGADLRQFQSGTDKKNGSEHPIEHLRTSLEHPPPRSGAVTPKDFSIGKGGGGNTPETPASERLKHIPDSLEEYELGKKASRRAK